MVEYKDYLKQKSHKKMTKTKKEIIQMLNKSIFLDGKRKARILALLEKADQTEKDEIFALLMKEKGFFKEFLKAYIEKGGQSAIDNLDQLFRKTDRVFRQGSEVKEKVIEGKKVGDILSQIDNA